ncbi:hydroxymethylbilane synthase [Alphaproteobacteria bacterium]|nr:hydroxymethylbilane synthase [Alphaproteobacteria bacterium]
MILKIKIATRKSQLALRQVDLVTDALGKNVEATILDIVTSGDKTLEKSLADIGGKGLFIKELENVILNDKADIAVHSMKDMETEIAQNTIISAVLPRGDRSDLLISGYSSFDDLPKGAVIGTSSVRRAAFAKSYRPDLIIKLLRGNVGTRIAKLNNGEFDGIILAKAGLDRLNINIGHVIPKEVIPPASTQGVIAIQSTNFKNTNLELNINNLLAEINDKKTYYETLAERSFLGFLDGSCRTPISASAYVTENNNLILDGAIAKLDGTVVIKSSISGLMEDAFLLGKELGKEIVSKGGKNLLAQ